LAIFEFLWVWDDLLLASTFVTGDSEHSPITPYLSYLGGTLVTHDELLSAGTFVAIAGPLAVFFAHQGYLARGLLSGAVLEWTRPYQGGGQGPVHRCRASACHCWAGWNCLGNSARQRHTRADRDAMGE
jgi:hypothetical protein